MEYKYPSKEYLIDEYINKGKTAQQIADENGVKKSTVQTHIFEKGIKKNRNKISKETLVELYENSDNSIMEVSRILGVNDRLVSKYLDKYGIKKEYDRYTKTIYNPINDKEWVRLYVEEKMSANQIAKMYNTTHGVILEHLRRCGIEIRDLQMSQLYYQGKYNLHPDLFNYEKMYNLHILQRLGVGVIADIYRIDIRTATTSLNKLNIPIYNSATTNLLPKTTSTPHNFESSLSQRVRSNCNNMLNPLALRRDNYRCRFCGSSENLEVHHIMKLEHIIFTIVDKYSQFNVVDNINELFEIVVNDPMYLNLDNLITVCSICHHRIHYSETQSEAKLAFKSI